MIKKEHKLKQITLFMALITLIFISISPVMADSPGADSPGALADSQNPKAMNDNQNTGQSQYVGPQNNSTKWNYTT